MALRRLGGIFIIVYNSLMDRCGQDAATFLSEVHSRRRTGHGRWKFELDVKGKNIAYYKTGQKLV